jgi:hypothetical protein
VDLTERVSYRACPRDPRHALLAVTCTLCDSQSPTDRALTEVGKFHWICWQQERPSAERHRAAEWLDLEPADFRAWAEASPVEHAQYVDYLAGCATFRPEDFARPSYAYLLGPGRAVRTLSLHPDGQVWCKDGEGPARWGCDPAGVLVLEIAATQYRFVGNAHGLHAGRRVDAGASHGEPALLVVWSEVPARTGLRLTPETVTAFSQLNADSYVEGDAFVGADARASMFGPTSRVRIELDLPRHRLRYDEQIELEGSPVFQGGADHPDWRMLFARPLG